MNLWSSLNGNLGKVPEHVASMDMDKNRMKGPEDDLLVDPTDLGKTSKWPVISTIIAVGIVTYMVLAIWAKMAVNDNSETFKVTAMSNGTAIELYENPMKVNAYKDGVWIHKDATSISGNLEEIIDQIPVVEWNETFDIWATEEGKLKWFNLYDENYVCVLRNVEEKEIKEFFVDAKPAQYYVVIGAIWEGKYVVKSFTNESFTSEFGVAIEKK